MNKTIISFYLIITAVVAGKAAQTVWERSQSVNDGFTIAAERAEQRSLQAELRQVTAELATERSLTTLAQAPELDGYVRISAPVVVTPAETTLASLSIAE